MPRALSGTAASAGEREFYITIQQLTEDQADSNFPTEAWTPLTKAWARRDFVTMDERTNADQLSTTVVQRWEIPYLVSMDPDRVDVAKQRRISYLNRTYDILSAEMLPRASGRSIVLTTLAKVG